MAEPGMEKQACRIRFLLSALESQAQLDVRVQEQLPGLFKDFSANPERFCDRADPITSEGDLLYKHPEPPLEITFRFDKDERKITFIDFSARSFPGALVVISYSHADEKWRDYLKTFLKPLITQKRLRIWDDTAIDAGGLWRDEIARFFGAASVAILLVSQDFLASDFIAKQELPQLTERARKKGMLLLWIAVSPSTYELDPVLKELQALNDPKNPLAKLSKTGREDALVDISKKIAAAIDQVAASRPV